MAFNKKQYDIEYKKKKKKQFKVDLNIDEYEELEQLLKAKGMTKVQLVREGLERLKNYQNR
jgi:hypothetical protein